MKAWVCVGLLAGCASTTPVADVQFGVATRVLAAQQVSDAEAPAKNAGRAVAGIEGEVAVEGIRRYYKSFAEPERQPHVLSIGLGSER